MKCVAIIPARGGSKGIPRKNVKLLAGLPLIAYIIRTAKHVNGLDRIIVSTEDEEIAEVAISYGAEVPFVRPKELALDDVPTLPVVQHTIRYLENREYMPDIIVLLYPTSPLIRHERISEAIRMLKEEGYDSVLSVVEDKGHYWIKRERHYERLYPKVVKNRQLTEPLMKETGGVYVCKRDLLMNEDIVVEGKIGFLIQQRDEALDIDDPIDFEIAEYLVEKRRR